MALPTPAHQLVSDDLACPGREHAPPFDLVAACSCPRIRALRWSADSRFIYFESNVTGRFGIWRVTKDGGEPEPLPVLDVPTSLGDPSPDGRWLLVVQDHASHGKSLHALPSSGGALRDVSGAHRIGGYLSARWSPDGQAVVFSAETERPGIYGLYVADLFTRAIREVAVGHFLDARWSPRGRHLALTRTSDFIHAGVSVLDLESGAEHVALADDGIGSSLAVAWCRDGRSVIVNSDRNDRDGFGVARLGVGDGALEWLVLHAWESYLLDASPVADTFVYARNEAGTHRIFLRDATSGADDVEVPLPAGTVSTARFSADGTAIALVHQSVESPTEIWTYDVRSCDLRKISRSRAAGSPSASVASPRTVVSPSFDSTPVVAHVYVPPNAPGSGPRPGIVYCHGGPTAQHENAWHPDIQYLVSRGFVVVVPDYRGSTGYGRRFRDANRKDLGGGDLADVVAAVDTLAAAGVLDRQCVAITGTSYGGYLALCALTSYPKYWCAGVAVVPFANWFTGFQPDDPILAAYDRGLMGDPLLDADLWRDRSPLFRVDQITAPLLVLAAQHDALCRVSESIELGDRLRALGREAEIHIYPNEGHGLSRRENQIDAARRIARFIEAHAGQRR